MIPDIIEEFRKTFKKENNNITKTRQKNINIRVQKGYVCQKILLMQ